MAGDRYLKLVLTVIAAELLWIGARGAGQPAYAQAPPVAPTRVVIAGIDAGANTPAYLPVAIVGTFKAIPPQARPLIEPLTAHVAEPIQIDTRYRPLKIEADKPLKVEPIRYTPGERPGE